MQLSLGPVLYWWPREDIEAFYERIVGSPLEVIYLGETVCSKRRALSGAEWIELGRQIQRRGTQVVLSTLALIESGSELAAVRRLCRNGELLVEANDMGAVQLMVDQKLPFVAGAGLNIYNAHTLKLLYRQGMRRWVAPVELCRQSLSDILDAARHAGVGEDLETEVFAFGRLPLAYSARCFTARAHDLNKDDCEFKCLAYPEGLPMATQEGEPVFTINGIQIQSSQMVNLLPHWQEAEETGVGLMRISPVPQHTREVVERFYQVISGTGDGCAPLETLPVTATCNGYWHGQAGIATVDTPAARGLAS